MDFAIQRYCILLMLRKKCRCGGTADALVSGSSVERRVGSNPVTCTRKRLRIGYNSESFSTKSTLSGGINRFHDEIPHTWDEISLDGGWWI